MGEDKIEWGSLAASEEEGMEVIKNAYGWTVAIDGTVFGLVAGDMGYDATHIVIPEDHFDATVEYSERYKRLRREYEELKMKYNAMIAYLAGAPSNPPVTGVEKKNLLGDNR